MKGNMFIFVVLPGLCFLPASFTQLYITVDKTMTWAEAQSYCRGNYADLATVSSQYESNKLVATALNHYNDHIWIGLYDDINSWRWSLQEEIVFGNGESDFRMWSPGEPNNFGGLEDCVRMDFDSLWCDYNCQIPCQFVCYNGNGETVNSSTYIFVNQAKNWTDAQSYCRQFYTDLVSVRNQTEQEKIKKLLNNQPAWIGLYRDSWKWSNGSPVTFKGGIFPGPSSNSFINTPCVAVHKGQWEAHKCDTKYAFVCQTDKPLGPVVQQIVRMKVATNKSVNLEEAMAVILEQISRTLNETGLSDNLQLSWREQLDGNIFSLENKEEKQEPKEICMFK